MQFPRRQLAIPLIVVCPGSLQRLGFSFEGRKRAGSINALGEYPGGQAKSAIRRKCRIGTRESGTIEPVPLDFPWTSIFADFPRNVALSFTRGQAPRDRLFVEIDAGRVAAQAIEPFDMLVRMKLSMDRGESPLSLSDDNEVQPFHGFMCDLDQIWQENGGDSDAT